jgi:hypothetical protein
MIVTGSPRRCAGKRSRSWDPAFRRGRNPRCGRAWRPAVLSRAAAGRTRPLRRPEFHDHGEFSAEFRRELTVIMDAGIPARLEPPMRPAPRPPAPRARPRLAPARASRPPASRPPAPRAPPRLARPACVRLGRDRPSSPCALVGHIRLARLLLDPRGGERSRPAALSAPAARPSGRPDNSNRHRAGRDHVELWDVSTPKFSVIMEWRGLPRKAGLIIAAGAKVFSGIFGQPAAWHTKIVS